MSRGRWMPYALAVLLFAAYSALVVSQHQRLKTGGYDLGIFEQAIRGYAHLGAPISTIKGPGVNLLGDHFHPILITVAPLYRLFPSALTILIFQAALLAVSAIPVARLAAAYAGVAGGACVGFAYGLSWGLQSALAFDFHEVSFAVPLISFSLVAIVEERWRAAVLWALPLVLVKEDLPATLAAIGLVIALRGQRRLGAAIVGFAAVAGVSILTLVIPHFNTDHVYAYTLNKFPSSQGPVTRFLTPAVKWETSAWLFLPTGFLSLFSSLAVIAVPTLVWRFWSTNPLYWEMGFQYSAVLMPVMFIAALETLSKTPFLRRDVRLRWGMSVAAAVTAIACTITFPLPLKDLFDPNTWRPGPAVAEAKAILERIPSGATVAADNHLAAQLTSRCTVYLFPEYPGDGLDPEWVVYRTPFDTSMMDEATITAGLARLQSRYTVVTSGPSTVLLRLRQS